MHITRSRPKLVVSTDGNGVANHAGSRLLADLADATSLTSVFSEALHRLRPRGTGHDPGRVAVDLAVMLADGGEAIADLAVLRDQPEMFGPVASTPTAWRALAGIDTTALKALRAARAQAREIAWLQADETGHPIPASHAEGRELPGLVLDIDATLVACHSEKEQAAATYKRGFGYHPLLCFLDNTGEALAGILRPGNAGANTAADHITVLDQALAQIPDAHRHGTGILVRADSAGGAKRLRIRSAVPRWTWWKRIVWLSVAVYSATGNETSPKATIPVHTGLAIMDHHLDLRCRASGPLPRTGPDHPCRGHRQPRRAAPPVAAGRRGRARRSAGRT